MKLKELVMEDFSANQIDEVKSPLQWTGGKFYIAEWIVSLMPKHKIYVEPFFGAGWVFFRKPRSMIEVINDIDDRVYALFKVLSDERLFQEFVEKIWFVGASEELVDICLRLKGKVILSGYQNLIYRRLEESGWIRLDKEIALRANVVERGQEKPKRVESVWLNYKVGRWLV